MKSLGTMVPIGTPEAMRALLRQYIVGFSFIKKNGGTERRMIGTLIPAVTQHPSPPTENDSDDRIVVFDVEKNEWRSFLFSTVSTPRVEIVG